MAPSIRPKAISEDCRFTVLLETNWCSYQVTVQNPLEHVCLFMLAEFPSLCCKNKTGMARILHSNSRHGSAWQELASPHLRIRLLGSLEPPGAFLATKKLWQPEIRQVCEQWKESRYRCYRMYWNVIEATPNTFHHTLIAKNELCCCQPKTIRLV